MSLSATAVRNAKVPAGKHFVRLTDEKGLVLEVRDHGGKWWRFRYRFNGKQKMLSLGTYPEVSLAGARERRDEARRLIADGIDPSEKRKQDAGVQRELAENSFEVIAREWAVKMRGSKWTEDHAARVQERLQKHAYPWIGHRPIAELEPPELLKMLQRVEARGALETTQRVKQYCGQIFRYAVATGRAERDPTQDLKGALMTPKTRHHASVTTPREVGELMRALDCCRASKTDHPCALKIDQGRTLTFGASAGWECNARA